MKLPKTEKIAAKLQEIMNDSTKEIASREAAIEEETKKIATNNDLMLKATDSGDMKAYQTAKKAKQDAVDAKEMYESRLKALQRKPLISKEEYEGMIAEITEELDSVNDQIRAKLAKLSEEMNEAAVEMMDAQEKANSILHTLQHNIFKDADRTRNADGCIIEMQSEVKRLDYGATFTWGKTAISHYQYTLCKK